MTSEECLKILKEGVASWNRWRQRNPNIRPDLSNANLSDADLRKVNFSHSHAFAANFGGANLQMADFGGAVFKLVRFNRADLRKVRFSGVDLYGSELSNADLREASLNDANLYGVRLRGANLTGADLTRANVTDAVLSHADFTKAHMGGMTIAGVDLSETKGLETTSHGSPSTVSIDTIFRSQGKIPEHFLRGCGVPEPFIRNMKSLVAAMEPIQFYSCFISYSNKDKEFAIRLHADLQDKGIRCWFAPENLKIGDKLRSSFDEAIHLHDKLMVILSESSIRSPWVEKEVETAFEKERQQKRTVLFPIRLDDTVMETKQAWAADIRRSRHIGDFRQWKNPDFYKKAFERLLRDLRSETKVATAAQSE